VMRDPAIARPDMDRKLKWHLLVGLGTHPSRHGEIDGFKIKPDTGPAPSAIAARAPLTS
jgi:hypothetical protein